MHNYSHKDKLELARHPLCPISVLDTFATECSPTDYTLCEALLLNEGLSSISLDLLIQKGLPAELQVLAAQHPNLSLGSKTKLISSNTHARLILLNRSDLTSDTILPLCLDPDPNVRLKAQNKLTK